MFAVAVVVQPIGLWWVRKDERTYDRVVQYLRRDRATRIVGYDKVWLCQLCAPLYFEKDLYFTDAPGTNRSYFSDSPASLEDYLRAPKPYLNNDILVLTHGRSLPELLPIEGGRSEEIAPRFWVWRPVETEAPVP